MMQELTKVFVAGSRHVSRLDDDVQRRLARIVEKGLPVIVGDANGVDKAVQAYLHGEGYDQVEVFCTGQQCRNNIGTWPLRKIAAPGKKRDFSFYATKDRAMAEEASYGFMIWDGKSVGTLMNCLRLVRRGKPVVVYTVPARRFTDLKGEADWDALISACDATLRGRIEQEAAAEGSTREESPTRVDGPRPSLVPLHLP